MCDGGNNQQRPQGPIPIIVCCKTEQIGAGVIQSLKPEYHAVHLILDAENASREIASVLRGEALLTPSNHLGSGGYDTGEALRPRAVLFGGACDDVVIEGIGEEVPLLKANQAATMPPLGPEYGRKIVQRAKACSRRLEEEGKFDETHRGVYLY
ncbi:hypothetical protein PG993_007257 [Apiospora rasikravindrae]|uniref:Uncharacterized protein n=1 Tax=Apiospora rasikravindrae TaxID=990691 RepID=A0ABR1SX00_9PEZI